MHHLRLGAKGGKINVLGRKAGRQSRKQRRKRPRLAARALVIAWALLAAEASGESPLEHCWKQSSARVELQSCLSKLLNEAEDRLEAAYSKAVRDATELDRVTGNRSDNRTYTLESESRWHEYRHSECNRQAQAMSPGTGSGDVLLACRIILTNERVKHLGMP